MSKDVMLKEIGVEAEETVADDWVLDDAGTLVRLAELCKAVVVEGASGSVEGMNEDVKEVDGLEEVSVEVDETVVND